MGGKINFLNKEIIFALNKF